MRPTALALATAATACAVLATAGAPTLAAQEPSTARARLVDAGGDVVGTARLHRTSGDGVLIRLRVDGVAPGVHAFHIHETGLCEPPGFESAGDHYSPRGRRHGFLDPRGPHAGDLPNLHVPASGELVVELLADDVTLAPGTPNTLFDDDGSALVVHADADDYVSQPAGGAGDRIACGVIRR